MELCAANFGLRQFRQYLLGRDFLLRNDHSVLKYVLTTHVLTTQEVTSRQAVSTSAELVISEVACATNLADVPVALLPSMERRHVSSQGQERPLLMQQFIRLKNRSILVAAKHSGSSNKSMLIQSDFIEATCKLDAVVAK